MLALNLISLSIKYAKLSFHLLNHYLYRIKLCDWNMQKQLTTIDVPSNFHITFIPYLHQLRVQAFPWHPKQETRLGDT
jgi:hypothetical protein